MNGDQAEAQMLAFLRRVTFEEARLDYMPRTALEQQMLARSGGH